MSNVSNNLLRTIGFYISAFVVIFILNKAKPTIGHDFAGLGTMVMIFILPVIICILLLINVFALIEKNFEVVYSIGIHVVALLVLLYYIFIG